MRGHVIPASSKVASTPGIRPTGSLRIALGERCFRVPPCRRHSFGSLSSVWSARDCQGNRRPQSPKCRAAFAAPCGHFASLVRSSSTARLPSENFVLLRRIWRPVQHLSPITSYARFEDVLRTLKMASGIVRHWASRALRMCFAL